MRSKISKLVTRLSLINLVVFIVSALLMGKYADATDMVNVLNNMLPNLGDMAKTFMPLLPVVFVNMLLVDFIDEKIRNAAKRDAQRYKAAYLNKVAIQYRAQLDAERREKENYLRYLENKKSDIDVW